MEELARKLISGTNEEFSKNIHTFQEEYGRRSVFEELNRDGLREKLWRRIYDHLTDHTQLAVHHDCLAALRILSRDKTSLDELATTEVLNIILENAGLAKICDEQRLTSYNNVTIESLKLLCNLLFNSVKVQHSVSTTSCLPYLIERISRYNDDTPYEIKLFDLRILFLVTALNVPARNIVRVDLNGDTHLIKILTTIVEKSENGTSLDLKKEEDVILSCEVLKILFNLYIHSDDTEEEEEKRKDLVSILRKLLLAKCPAKQDELESNVVNLLTVIPYNCYSPIIRPIAEDIKESKAVYQNMDMTAVSVLLKFLDARLDCKTNLIENLSPIVTAFVRLVRAERSVRKYVRLQILPPLKDVMKRPEEGTTLRAKLCKLLTSPLTELRDLVAEFLFVLCKENVTRMVKYTGYGNAAGMFANKGLLGRNQPKTSYSSESEDSETEEYQKYKEQINPVTGCFEPPKPNPLEGMTEEQKEYEALQLVGLVDKLTREGVVQPCRIGEDGKPKPIEHVLELQEDLPKQQFHRRNSDSD